jgi:hypothetical protein
MGEEAVRFLPCFHLGSESGTGYRTGYCQAPKEMNLIQHECQSKGGRQQWVPEGLTEYNLRDLLERKCNWRTDQRRA